MPTDLLTRCGVALYGAYWQTDLADALDISDRTVRRWVAGDTPVPAGVYADLMRLMLERAQTLDDLVEECRRAGAP